LKLPSLSLNRDGKLINMMVGISECSPRKNGTGQSERGGCLCEDCHGKAFFVDWSGLFLMLLLAAAMPKTGTRLKKLQNTSNPLFHRQEHGFKRDV